MTIKNPNIAIIVGSTVVVAEAPVVVVGAAVLLVATGLAYGIYKLSK